MTPLQDAIQFITAQRDLAEVARINRGSDFWFGEIEGHRDAYNNVLTVLGNMELSEADLCCWDVFTSRPRCDSLSEPEQTLWLIGQRIFERIAAQRKEES